MLISTPTFCQSYVRRIEKGQFAHLKYAIVGAEKLREPLATAFEQHFGIPLLEGYGCTEMAPVVAVNRPNVDHHGEKQTGRKFGSVGHPIPGVAAKVVDQETGEGPLVGRPGLLLVKGPNMMVGYLNQPERTAEVIRDGWYVTNDIAMIDEDGFIFLTDRLSRFSKIGGEMVPHMKIEEAINLILGRQLHGGHVGGRSEARRAADRVLLQAGRRAGCPVGGIWARPNCPSSGSLVATVSSRLRPFPRSAPARWTCANSARWPRSSRPPKSGRSAVRTPRAACRRGPRRGGGAPRQ